MKLKFILPMVILLTASCKGDNGDTEASGRFEADEIVISSELSGKIVQMWAHEGSTVKAGESIALIDTVQLYLQKQRLLAAIESIKARKVDVSKQISALNQQIDHLTSERERAQRLLLSNAGNAKTVDDLDSQILTLKKQREAQLSTLEKGNSAADREVESLKIQIAQTEDMLSKSLIKSPSDGNILVKYASKGEISMPGKPLFKMADMESMTLRAYIGANQLSIIKVGDTVEIVTGFDNQTLKSYEGVVEWVSGEAEFTPKSIQTKEERSNLVYAVKIAVKNDGYLKIGMYGDVKLKGGN
ncbi:MAG: efflux RND transporter periplasmic adaptor subunit [Bacteroidales bacterium]|nr:efflux RND transporter periplasmic adaptor subunit [Bacteroidales bacterium]